MVEYPYCPVEDARSFNTGTQIAVYKIFDATTAIRQAQTSIGRNVVVLCIGGGDSVFCNF